MTESKLQCQVLLETAVETLLSCPIPGIYAEGTYNGYM